MDLFVIGEIVKTKGLRGCLKAYSFLENQEILDGLGFVGSDTAWSLYECPDELADLVRSSLQAHPGLVEGDPWFQGDHMVFTQQGVPAVALTSTDLGQMMQHITHTPNDSPDKVDPQKLAEAALALRDLVMALTA